MREPGDCNPKRRGSQYNCVFLHCIFMDSGWRESCGGGFLILWVWVSFDLFLATRVRSRGMGMGKGEKTGNVVVC